MERLKQRLASARRALATLRELVGLDAVSPRDRDAAIQRFEYTFEAVWKAVQLHLKEREGLDAASPKSCVRASRELGLLSDAQAEAALRMTDDRNLTSHTYNEGLAKAIYSRLATHADLLGAWLDAIEPR